MWRPPADDLYARLGVQPDADVAAIRQAWKTKIRQLHPDGRPDHEQQDAHHQAVLLNEARDVLTDPSKRLEYDLGRRTASRAQPRPEPPAAPEPPTPPPEVVVKPETIRISVVLGGQTPRSQLVRLSYSDGSTVGRVELVTVAGTFWQAELVEVENDHATLRVEWQPEGGALSTGLWMDRLEVTVNGIVVQVPMLVLVEQPARPPRPAAPSPPPRAAAAPPQPEVRRPDNPRSSRRPRRAVFAVVLLVLLVIGALYLLGKKYQNGPAAPPATPSPYCSVTSKDGVMSFYQADPSTGRAAGDMLWASMKARASDEWISWWTPGFPYWERANQAGGFKEDGRTYAQHQDVQVSVVWAQGFESLDFAFKYNPGLDQAAEEQARQRFLGEWIGYLDSPTCP
ncbi:MULTISPECIES: J domain-containing protein [Kitasatospora]|uniref:J domain-containing protein n=1 Tax=Kitasatospora setae (strain ATCC 33774 / DSM 43861 / JCM 3304 / KCC A-0304 / NBRC 14216 / KM-6054) TaxID=452652 RepID=E4NHN2_KITSK|nr:J domain-containing protein [Kitasatospora setae]BAJ31012.1 hypothetical protein KSE_52360 [Kitasatospora setae KM-6054]